MTLSFLFAIESCIRRTDNYGLIDLLDDFSPLSGMYSIYDLEYLWGRLPQDVGPIHGLKVFIIESSHKAAVIHNCSRPMPPSPRNIHRLLRPDTVTKQLKGKGIQNELDNLSLVHVEEFVRVGVPMRFYAMSSAQIYIDQA